MLKNTKARMNISEIIALLCGVAAIVIAIVGMSRSWSGKELTMSVFTGSGLIAGSLGLILTLHQPLREWRKFISRTCALVSMALGTYCMLDFWISGDHLQMSFFTALNFALFGMALLFVDEKSRVGRHPFQYLALLALIAPGQTLLFNLYGMQGARMLRATDLYGQMAISTASAWCLLSIGLLLSRPSVGIMVVFTSDNYVGRFVRQLLVPSLVLPTFLGWFIARHDVLPFSQQLSGASFLAFASLIIYVFILWKNGIELFTLHHERDLAEERWRRAMASAEEANQTKSTFLANMSHEIRSPVGVMIGVSDLIADARTKPEDRRRYADIMKKNGQTLLTIIDDILDLSKVEAGKLQIESNEVSLPDLVNELIWVYQNRAKEKGVAVKINWEGVFPERIVTDPVRLRQILTNMLSNAVKFTSQGWVSLTIRVTQWERNPRQAHLSFEVQDTGPGILDSSVKNLFQPFAQGDPSVSRKFGGSGLGLSLSKRLAKALKGDLFLQETSERGSTFVLKIPAPLPEGFRTCDPAQIRQEAQERVPSITSHQRRLEGQHLLLVDDAADNRMLLKWILDHEGAEVDLATNGKEALSMTETRQYDVILMDIQMPVMDGLTASMRLRERGYHLPILALTAHAMKEDRERSLMAGLNDHISKPIQKELLIEKLCLLSATVRAKVATNETVDPEADQPAESTVDRSVRVQH